MTQNALAAILACLQFGIDPEIIVKGVTSFYPGEAQTPGRMNIYQFKQCQVMVDFAHNPEGFTGIAAFLKSNHAKYKIGIIVGTGDARKFAGVLYFTTLIALFGFEQSHTLFQKPG